MIVLTAPGAVVAMDFAHVAFPAPAVVVFWAGKAVIQDHAPVSISSGQYNPLTEKAFRRQTDSATFRIIADGLVFQTEYPVLYSENGTSVLNEWVMSLRHISHHAEIGFLSFPVPS